MMTALRSLVQHGDSSPELPRIPELEDLYNFRGGVRFRQGMVGMIVGRSGAGKSAFALWLCRKWNARTLYLSGDMSPFTVSTRLASMSLRATTAEVEAMFKGSDIARAAVLEALEGVRINLSFASPITWRGIDEELFAYVELWNRYPDVMVVDNAMDIENCHSDYTEQMAAMQELTALARATGMTILILHHATDKGTQAAMDPFSPPSRNEVKGGLSEKPELTLSVALNPVGNAFRVAPIKQRDGYSDPSGKNYVTLQARPEWTTYERYDPRAKL